MTCLNSQHVTRNIHAHERSYLSLFYLPHHSETATRRAASLMTLTINWWQQWVGSRVHLGTDNFQERLNCEFASSINPSYRGPPMVCWVNGKSESNHQPQIELPVGKSPNRMNGETWFSWLFLLAWMQTQCPAIQCAQLCEWCSTSPVPSPLETFLHSIFPPHFPKGDIQ